MVLILEALLVVVGCGCCGCCDVVEGWFNVEGCVLVVLGKAVDVVDELSVQGIDCCWDLLLGLVDVEFSILHAAVPVGFLRETDEKFCLS